MRVVPKSNVGRIQFYELHIAPFTANAAAIGLSVAEVEDIENKTEIARAAYEAHQAAQLAARAATLALNLAVSELSIAGSAAIAKVRATAQVSGNLDVYALASLPVPANPRAVGALGKPDHFKLQVDQSGALTLTWKNRNPESATGVVYQIRRRLGSNGAFEYLGTAGEKKYIDTTVPPGTAQVQYQVQAMRSTSVGPLATFNVFLGGGRCASVVQGKQAAMIAA